MKTGVLKLKKRSDVRVRQGRESAVDSRVMNIIRSGKIHAQDSGCDVTRIWPNLAR